MLAAGLRAAAEVAEELAASASPGRVPAAAATRGAVPAATTPLSGQRQPAPDVRQPAAHEVGQPRRIEATMELFTIGMQCCSGAQPGGGSESGAQGADALLEAANALLEAATGPLGGPLRRHLLSAAADINYFAGEPNTLCTICRRCCCITQRTVTRAALAQLPLSPAHVQKHLQLALPQLAPPVPLVCMLTRTECGTQRQSQQHAPLCLQRPTQWRDAFKWARTGMRAELRRTHVAACREACREWVPLHEPRTV